MKTLLYVIMTHDDYSCLSLVSLFSPLVLLLYLWISSKTNCIPWLNLRSNWTLYLPSLALTDENTELGYGEATASVVSSSGSFTPHDGQNLKSACNFEPHWGQKFSIMMVNETAFVEMSKMLWQSAFTSVFCRHHISRSAAATGPERRNWRKSRDHLQQPHYGRWLQSFYCFYRICRTGGV